MRIKLGRKKTLVLRFTGQAGCGCRYYEGDLWAPCDTHLERMVLKTGRHRNDDQGEAQLDYLQ